MASFLSFFSQPQKTTQTQLEQLADLAVVNERLAGGSGPQARARVDFLKGRRRLWARVYDVVTRSDVGATLDAIERATGEVRGALELDREGGGKVGSSSNKNNEEEEGASSQRQRRQQQTERERLGVAALRERLVSLQAQLAAATERISTSRARLSYNEERLRSLKAAQEALEAALAREEEKEEEKKGAAAAAAAATTTAATTTTSPPLPLPLPLLPLLLSSRGSWLPLAFVADLDRKPGLMLPVEVDGVPWVLFRTGLSSNASPPPPPSSSLSPSSSDAGESSDGFFDTSPERQLQPIPGDENLDSSSSSIACLRDECAHRACPLSLGKVDAAGRAVCPYHGWAYDGLSGSCVEMPSTLHRRGVGVESMRVGVRDGVVWGWRREREKGSGGGSSSVDSPSSSRNFDLPLPPLPPLPATAATPRGFVVVAEATVANSAAPPEKIRDALAQGRAWLATREPASAAARGLLPSSSEPSSVEVEVTTTEEEEGEAAGAKAFAVVTLASGFGGNGSSSSSSSSSMSSITSLRPLRLLHLVAPGRDGGGGGGSRLLLRVSVAEGAVAAVFGSGKRRLWAALAAEAAEADARLGGEGEEMSEEEVAAAAADASVTRL